MRGKMDIDTMAKHHDDDTSSLAGRVVKESAMLGSAVHPPSIYIPVRRGACSKTR